MAAHSFSAVPRSNISRSSFKRDHGFKTTFDSGYLVPFFVDEVLPGDTFNLNVNLFARLATPVVPIMDNIYMDTFFFFVPNRLVWDNFEKFMGAQDNPGDSIDYLVPQVEVPAGGFPVQSVADYFGLPVNIDKMPTVNALPFRALNLIYNEWFRDENLQDSLQVYKGDGPDPWIVQDNEGNDVEDSDGNPVLSYPLFRRGKRHDYMTSSMPWPQKGPGVDLPLGVSAPVIGNGTSFSLTDGTNDYGIFSLSGDSSLGAAQSFAGVPAGSTQAKNGVLGSSKAYGVSTDPVNSGLIADLSDAVSPTINDLRYAFMLQQFLERDSVGGTRYKEILLSHFNTVAPDFRLDRPEYLGGSSGMVNIHQVAQTSSTDSSTPQGNLAAYGVYADSRHGFTKSFVEHGYIIGLVNVRADLTYQQGIERFWSRLTRYDFYWPTLAHLGEQAVLNKEIYAQSTEVLDDNGDQVNDGVFGYQERYAEYRYKPSLVTGKLRSGTGNSLDVWHLSQYFENLPVLNSEFIEDRPPIERAIAVQNEPQFILDAWFRLNTVRPMPVHGVPGFQSHF